MTGGRHRQGRAVAGRKRGRRVPVTRTGRRRSLLLLTLMLAGMTGLISVHSVTPASAALQGNVEIGGHGYGHGRGLSQYGALGYAVDYGSTWQQILDHYYGGTVAGTRVPGARLARPRPWRWRPPVTVRSLLFMRGNGAGRAGSTRC